MGKRHRHDRNDGGRTDGTPTIGGRFDIDTGFCELVRDDTGYLLKINGVESSHIHDDPQVLEFEYMRWFAELIDERIRDDESLRALHLGGAACTMARYLASVHPQARQVAVEIDGALATYVRDWFDLPRSPFLRIRVGDAREVVESLSADSRDVVLRDVFDGMFTPSRMTTVEFVAAVRRVLSPDGLYVINCGDAPDLRVARSEAATIGDAFENLAIIADSAMLKGRRRGNVVIAGSDARLGQSPLIARNLLGGSTPAQLLLNDEARAFAKAASPGRDADLAAAAARHLRATE
ncbi:spermidine synthase [Jongsikchunia kroppenstedtii]|uniref:spermidine synthase n=1 Tax=Jongsikchunia kroppenstedtii TaxID=1121721 RepID=UPI00035E04C0|nr:fused MFS/spermidine synthase [Jongsikchunia kroppenstedtii]